MIPMPPTEVVWLLEKRRYALLLNMGAYYSQVLWTENGIDYEDLIPNDEWEFWEERAIDYECE